MGKNIEIYATLPKKKGKKAAEMLLQQQQQDSTTAGINDEDHRYEQQRSSGRQSRSSAVQQHYSSSSSSSSSSGGSIGRRERAKSEERNRSKPNMIPAAVPVVPAQQYAEEDPSSDSSKSAGKKQHRIRRRLLMGGLIKRKNRSLPDLRADEDDGMVSGGPSEPEDAPTAAVPVEDASNASLEKSKLMRKGFALHQQHQSAVAAAGGSLGRPLSMNQQHSPQNKVPPPPPVRKTSHLMTPAVPETITVRADIHHERTNSDLVPNHHTPLADPLPPYPMVEHVRQASDDFPPPPPPQELQRLSCDSLPAAAPVAQPVQQEEEEEDVPDASASNAKGLLAELKLKRKQILGSGTAAPVVVNNSNTTAASGNPWLQELQNTIQAKKMIPLPSAGMNGNGMPAALPHDSNMATAEADGGSMVKSVRKLASRFEQTVRMPPTNGSVDVVDHAPTQRTQQPSPVAVQQQTPPPVQQMVISPTKPAGPVSILDRKNRRSNGDKKKSVTFCDQVILVSTAEDTEQDETYVPNPILQRVLRSAYHQQQSSEQPSSSAAALTTPNFTVNSGGDEVDRPVTNRPPPYQRLPVNSQVFQQQQQQQPPQNSVRHVPSSPMMGQRIAPPSYAPPPQYPHHARAARLNGPPGGPSQGPIQNGGPMARPFVPQHPAAIQQQQHWQQPPPQQYNLTPCSLCGKKQVPSSHQYCGDCQFYMQRFQPKA